MTSPDDQPSRGPRPVILPLDYRPGPQPLRFKLDENLSPLAADILGERGYDARTVVGEGLRGSSDELVAEVCRRENRSLLTLDLHFANPFAYPPAEYAGIIVLRHPRPRLNDVQGLVEQLANELSVRNPAGQLWIVEPGRTRIHTGRNE